jgi:hypothetical protein
MTDPPTPRTRMTRNRLRWICVIGLAFATGKAAGGWAIFLTSSTGFCPRARAAGEPIIYGDASETANSSSESTYQPRRRRPAVA